MMELNEVANKMCEEDGICEWTYIRTDYIALLVVMRINLVPQAPRAGVLKYIWGMEFMRAFLR